MRDQAATIDIESIKTVTTEDGKRLIEQVVKDFASLLDVVYFPYRDK